MPGGRGSLWPGPGRGAMRVISFVPPLIERALPPVPLIILRVFLPFALGYYVSYLYRTINAVIFSDLAADLGLQAAALGLLTSAYFFVFALVQIPLGLALDRFGPRRVDASLLVVAAGGALAFSFGHDTEELVLARALIGLGVSAALMASMKALVMWFPADRLASVNGWLLMVGGIGAMSATAPVEAALRVTDWRGIFVGLAGFTLAVALVIWFAVPERPGSAKRESLAELWAGLLQVARSRQFWRIAFLAMTLLGPSVAIQGLWVSPWLRDMLGVDRQVAAGYLLAFTGTMAVGFLAFGVASDWLAGRGFTPERVLFLANLSGASCLALLAAGVTTGAVALWIAYNFLATAGTVAYAILSKTFAEALAGRVATSLNMASFVVAFAIQYGFGAVLERFGTSGTGYSPAGYALALGTVVVAQIGSLVFYLWRPRGSVAS